MNKGTLAACIAVIMLTVNGCTALLVGGGVAGTVAVSQDSARLEIDRSFNECWIASSKAIVQMGVITFEDLKGGAIEANVRDAKVSLAITPVTKKTVRIVVKARKNLLPQKDLAAEIIGRIHDQLT